VQETAGTVWRCSEGSCWLLTFCLHLAHSCKQRKPSSVTKCPPTLGALFFTAVLSESVFTATSVFIHFNQRLHLLPKSPRSYYRSSSILHLPHDSSHGHHPPTFFASHNGQRPGEPVHHDESQQFQFGPEHHQSEERMQRYPKQFLRQSQSPEITLTRTRRFRCNPTKEEEQRWEYLRESHRGLA
jgi:hypothetical protein